MDKDPTIQVPFLIYSELNQEICIDTQIYLMLLYNFKWSFTYCIFWAGLILEF